MLAIIKVTVTPMKTPLLRSWRPLSTRNILDGCAGTVLPELGIYYSDDVRGLYGSNLLGINENRLWMP
jgi:hypothetical protein